MLQKHAFLKIINISTLFVVILFLLSCNSRSYKYTIQEQTMGTYYSITIVSDKKPSSNYYSKLSEQIHTTLNNINEKMSTHISTSEVSIWNKKKNIKWNRITSEFYKVLKTAIVISQKTNGKYDVTLAPIIHAWGFQDDPINPSLKQIIQKNQSVKVWFHNQNIHYGYQHLKLRKKNNQHILQKKIASIQINFSSIAKGYAVDQIALLLQQHTENNFLIDIGGELYVQGYSNINKKQKWNIGIQNPKNPNQLKALNTISIEHGSIATSGNYRNLIYIENIPFSHTMDSKTLRPVKSNILSVSVYNSICMIADAWATALMTMKLKEIQKIVAREQIATFVIFQEGKKTKKWSSKIWKKKVSSTK